MGDFDAAAPDPSSPTERAVTMLMRTNRCDRRAAREILAASALRHGLEELELAVTLLALGAVKRTARRPL